MIRRTEKVKEIVNVLNTDQQSTYSALHSFITLFKRSGVNIASLSESLEHAYQKTTKNYFANHLRNDKNMDTFNALIGAGKARLRPILMTTFAMIFRMLPIALASGNGAELKTGMAWVIIGGLTSSMILTLVVVPIVYYILHRITARISHFKRNRMIEKVKSSALVESAM